MKAILGLAGLLTVLVVTCYIQAPAWQGMPTPPLHVEGNKLKDPAGNDINLYGWFGPTSSYFNGSCFNDPNDWSNPTNVSSLLNFMNGAASVMSDTMPKYGYDHGWYSSFVRLNTDAIGGWNAELGLHDTAQFNGWLNNFIIPYANHLYTRGLYLVICATGPINTPNNGAHNAGAVEQQRLITFWQTLAKTPGIKDAPNIMFELMNEPVDVETVMGNGQWGLGKSVYFEAFTKWMQPVINAVRNTGAKNIMWVPTLEWQGSPHQWAEFPFTGTNIGVAAHFYPAYGGCHNNETCIRNLWERQYKPAADRWPMIITEMGWDSGVGGLGDGSTAIWGNTAKSVIDNQGNVSYNIGFLDGNLNLNSCLTNPTLKTDNDGTVAAFSWWREYAKTSVISHGIKTVPGKVEVENYESMAGIQVESNQGDVTARHIGYINNGDFTEHLINVPTTGDYTIKFRVATGVDENNRIVVKNQAGVALCTLAVDASRSNGWHDWYLDSTAIGLIAGEQRIRLEYVGTSAYLFNLDWFDIQVRQQTVGLLHSQRNGAVGVGIMAPDHVRSGIYNAQGKLVAPNANTKITQPLFQRPWMNYPR